MFGLSLIRTQAILKLQWMEEKVVEEEGYDTDGEAMDAHMEDHFDVQLAQWDPNVFDNLSKEGEVDYVSEGDLEILRRIEKQRNDKYWKREEYEVLKEKAMYETGQTAYGAPAPGMPPPEKLSDVKHKAARHITVMTAIDDAKRANYRVAVRDRTGALREPSEEEFLRVRRREKGRKAFFNHVPYTYGEKI